MVQPISAARSLFPLLEQATTQCFQAACFRHMNVTWLTEGDSRWPLWMVGGRLERSSSPHCNFAVL